MVLASFAALSVLHLSRHQPQALFPSEPGANFHPTFLIISPAPSSRLTVTHCHTSGRHCPSRLLFIAQVCMRDANVKHERIVE
jgi:hypothetical protein